MDKQIDKEQLKKHIEKLELEVYTLSKIILSKTDDSKNLNEDIFTDDEKEESKIKNAELKAYKSEQKEKDKQLKILRSIYTNLVRDLKNNSNGKPSDAIAELLKGIKELNYQSNTPPIQQKQ